MGLSSNTLWHQTKKDGLKGIIRDQCLYYAYSEESVISTEGNLQSDFAFPMISVCDLPFSEVGTYLKKYGDYTIGFSSEWGRKNGFSTVWYCDNTSKALLNLLKLFIRKIGKYSFDTSKDIEYQRIIYLMSHVKQYEGPLKKKHYKKYRFYDEREQRLVPEYNDLNTVGELQFIADYKDYKGRHKGSPFLPKSLNVPFEWDDVKYIIVEKEEEKNEIRDLIEKQAQRRILNISYFANKEVREDVIGLSHDVQEITRSLTNEEIDTIINDLHNVLSNSDKS